MFPYDEEYRTLSKPAMNCSFLQEIYYLFLFSKPGRLLPFHTQNDRCHKQINERRQANLEKTEAVTR